MLYKYNNPGYVNPQNSSNNDSRIFALITQFLPNQAGNSGKVLGTNGSTLAWVTGGGGGVVSIIAGTNIVITGTPTNPVINSVGSERENDWVAPYSYCGTAPNGSSTSSPVWTIYRIQVANDGTVTTLSATNVAWTNRYIVIYT